MASANMTIQIRFNDDQLEQLADLIAAKIKTQPRELEEHDEVAAVGSEKSIKKAPEKATKTPAAKEPKPTGDGGRGSNTSTKDDLGAWDIDTEGLRADIEASMEAGYDDDYEPVELHDLTNAELEQVILDNPMIAPLHKSKMVKDELVQLVNVGFAVDSGEFDELLKDDLLLAAEALGVRDEVTTKTRKNDVLKVVDKAYSNR